MAVVADNTGSIKRVTKKSKYYPLEIDGIGTDVDPFHVYSVISRGHHDVHEFMKKVHEVGYSVKFGMPRHEWYRTCPDHSGRTNLIKASQGGRGVFPVTVASVTFGKEDTYEHLNAAS
jgi:hypothetical protein